tara:strand:+ start:1228 stop:2172 length:945 start_codon:yes stop_codon:yes gene_type:complete
MPASILTESLKYQLMKRFPKVELSYDNILHKKVHADYFAIIPRGPKAFMWLTYIGNKSVCIILTLNHKGNVKAVELYPMIFDKTLSHGTVIYGTIFRVDLQLYFTFENLFYVKGHSVSQYDYSDKLKIYSDLFQYELSQKTYTKNSIIPGLPIICRSYTLAEEQLETLLYPVYSIQAYTKKRYVGTFPIHRQQKRYANFVVRARSAEDIYYLYAKDKYDEEKMLGVAMISTYKMSVMMNSIFRTIKENINLDYLEESDSEEEFENIAEDKFVDLQKSVVMRCEYVKKFQKWRPIVIVDEPCVSIKQAILMEKNI